MPTVKNGSVTDHVGEAVKEARGKLEYKADKVNVLHTAIGRTGFKDEEIRGNIQAMMEEVRNHAKASKGAKRRFVKSVYLSTTRGPGLMLSDVAI
jgi:large subunit ribosomal protein L1